MLEELAHDYSNYFHQADITKEINPICTNIDDMLNRLDEFESLMSIVQNDAAITTQHNLTELFACEEEFQKLCKKIDDLERFVTVVNNNLNTLELHVSTAEEELGVNALGLKGLLKPIFGKSKKKCTDGNNATDAGSNAYEPPNIFRTEEFFGNNSVDVAMEA